MHGGWGCLCVQERDEKEGKEMKKEEKGERWRESQIQDIEKVLCCRELLHMIKEGVKFSSLSRVSGTTSGSLSLSLGG